MGIFNKELPDELKDLGLTPTQIKEQLAKAKEFEDKVTTQGAELTAARAELDGVKGDFASTKARLDQIEANNQRQQEPPKKDDPISFLDDENAAFNQRFNQAANPLAQIALTAAATTAKMSARNSLRDKVVKTPNGNMSLAHLWDRWESDIDKLAEGVPLVNRGNPITWANLFNLVKGRHMDELLANTSDFIEPASGSSDREVHVGERRQSLDKLSEDEEKQAKKMRIDPAKFLEMKKKMRFVSA